jgi:hypothetical protein
MALNVGDRLTLRATVVERIHLGGDHNVCLEADGVRLWVTESKLAAFVEEAENATRLTTELGRKYFGARANGLAPDETDLPPAPVTPKPPARKR